MYYVKINWYNERSDEDIISHMIICAADWNDAMQKITSRFTWINSIKMREIDSCEHSVVFIPDNMIDAIIAENTY